MVLIGSENNKESVASTLPKRFGCVDVRAGSHTRLLKDSAKEYARSLDDSDPLINNALHPRKRKSGHRIDCMLQLTASVLDYTGLIRRACVRQIDTHRHSKQSTDVTAIASSVLVHSLLNSRVIRSTNALISLLLLGIKFYKKSFSTT